MSATALTGVFPVLQTPWRDDECLDQPTLQREVDWVLEVGCHGVTLGMVSEVQRLASEERDALTEAVCQAVAGRVPVIASVGAESGHTARRHARRAEQAGAAVMAIPPVMTALSPTDLFRYYGDIFEAIDIPVVVQDASGYLGAEIPISTQAELLDRFGDRAYFKPEAAPIGPRLTALLTATDQRARVFEGTGGIALVDSYRRGVVGTMPAADMCWALLALWNALVAGDDARVDAINGPLASMVSLQSSLDLFVACEKYLLHKQGIFPTRAVRGPGAVELDRFTTAELDRLFDLIGQAVHR